MSTSEKKKSNPHAGHRERVRKRFLEQGGESFEKHELLELLLYNAIPMQDTNPIAHRLMDNFDNSFNILLNSDCRDIVSKCNVSINTAIFLTSIGEVVKRCQKERIEGRAFINSTEMSGKYASDLMMYETTEKFYMLCLDAGNHLIQAICISHGSQSRVQVEIGDVVKEALLSKAVSVIFAHNHPGGNLYPSKADINLTLALIFALKTVGINVIDHIITSGEDYFSFADNGFIKNDDCY